MQKIIFISLSFLGILLSTACTKVNQIAPYDYASEIRNYDAIDPVVQDLPYYYTANVLADPNEENLKELVSALVEDTDSTKQKAKRIHDWITINILYDLDRYNDGDHRPYFYTEVLRSRLTMCGGFTDLFFVMCRMADIRVASVTGDPANNHIWNAFWYNSQWMHVDNTWDAGSYTGGEISPSYSNTYFFVTEDVIATKPNHAKDGGSFHYDETKAPYSGYE